MPTDRSPSPAAIARMLAALQKGPDDPLEKTLMLWDSLAVSLVAIIGEEGFNALFSRSLYLAEAAHPWLAEAPLTRGSPPRFAALKAMLQGRTPDEVAPAMALLFSIFSDVLGTLIGKQLTTHILRTAWGDAYDEAAEEISPWPKN